MTNAFTWAFLAALAAATSTRLWLAQRQMRHVAAHRGAVPATFSDAIPLEAHQKAADYTVAKARVGMLDLAIGAAVTLWLFFSRSSSCRRRPGCRRRSTAPSSSRSASASTA
jgi:STE24 endopeptidase